MAGGGGVPLDADAVRATAFTVTRGHHGYEMTEVDAFLERAASELSRPVASRTLTADEVGSVRFGSTTLRQGYEQEEVDAFLDRVAEQLR